MVSAKEQHAKFRLDHFGAIRTQTMYCRESRSDIPNLKHEFQGQDGNNFISMLKAVPVILHELLHLGLLYPSGSIPQSIVLGSDPVPRIFLRILNLFLPRILHKRTAHELT